MSKLHTDRQILRCLYDMHVDDYPAKGAVHLPVDVGAVAARLGCNTDLLFGRLYYDMGTRLKHRSPADPHHILAAVFDKTAGGDVINFPYLAGLLASMDHEHRKASWTIGLSIFAAVVSVLALLGPFVTPALLARVAP